MAVRFAVIGTGNISGTHIDAIKSIEDCELVAIMSHSKERAEEFARRYNVKAYYNIDELIRDSNIDVVDIASYHNVHAEYALKAVKAGKHVMIEKPLSINTNNIDKIIEESKRRNLLVNVISQHRFDGALNELKKMINDDKLGKILFVNVDVINSRSQDYYSASEWRKSMEKAGGGVMMMNAVHFIDILIWLFGEAKSVYGKMDNIKHNIEVEDTANVIIKFKNNTIATLNATTAANYNHPFRMNVYGSKQSLLIEGNNIVNIDYFDYNNRLNRIKYSIKNRLPFRINKSERYQIGTIKQQIKSFVDNVNNNMMDISSLIDGKNAVKVILAAYKSSKSGREVIIK